MTCMFDNLQVKIMTHSKYTVIHTFMHYLAIHFYLLVKFTMNMTCVLVLLIGQYFVIDLWLTALKHNENCQKSIETLLNP